MTEVLGSLITEYKDDTKNCLEKIKPLAQVLQPPITIPTPQQIEAVIQLYFYHLSPLILSVLLQNLKYLLIFSAVTKKAARVFAKHANLHIGRDCCFQPFNLL